MSRSRLLPLSVLILSVLFLRLPAAGAEALRIATPELALCGSLEKGRPSGFCYELGNELAREAGVESVNSLEPLARAVDGVLSGGVDMSFLVPDQKILFGTKLIAEVLSIPLAAWARAGVPLRCLGDLQGRTVAVVRGGQFERKIRELRAVPIPTRSYEQGLKLLLVDRAEVVAGPAPSLAEAARKLNLDRRAMGKPLGLGSLPLRIVVSKGLDDGVTERLRAAWQRLRDNGVLAGLVEKYKL